MSHGAVRRRALTRLSARAILDILARSEAWFVNRRGTSTMKRTILLLALCLSGACTSASGGPDASGATDSNSAGKSQGEAVSMIVTDYRSGAVFELVSQAHTAALDQYSKVAADASRKVQDDELMTALRDYLVDEGLDELAQPGKAPRLAKGAKAWTLEVSDAKGARHVIATPQTSADDMKRMRTLLDAVLATYNETQGWQAVDIKAKRGDEYFEQTRPTGKNP